MNTLLIRIPSLPENIRIVESFIDNAKEKFSLDDNIYGNIMVAVTESVNNAIVHGNKSDKKKDVCLQLFIEKKSLRFVVEDQGGGFDPSSLSDPTLPENIVKENGRGIYLMQTLCDEILFENEGRRIEMSFDLS